MTVQVTKSGIVSLESEKETLNMQDEFNKNHCIKLPKFLKKIF